MRYFSLLNFSRFNLVRFTSDRHLTREKEIAKWVQVCSTVNWRMIFLRLCTWSSLLLKNSHLQVREAKYRVENVLQSQQRASGKQRENTKHKVSTHGTSQPVLIDNFPPGCEDTTRAELTNDKRTRMKSSLALTVQFHSLELFETLRIFQYGWRFSNFPYRRHSLDIFRFCFFCMEIFTEKIWLVFLLTICRDFSTGRVDWFWENV